MSDAPVLLDVSPAGVAVVTINRPEKHNAFNAEVIAALSEIFETLRANPLGLYVHALNWGQDLVTGE